jgi:hypothetical protein
MMVIVQTRRYLAEPDLLQRGQQATGMQQPGFATMDILQPMDQPACHAQQVAQAVASSLMGFAPSHGEETI